MRLPWEKLAMEVIEVSAPELGAELYPELEPEMAEALAGWGIVKAIKWALARCPDHQPPSASDLVPGASAARQIARAAGYRGNPETYVQAASKIAYPILELVSDGIRFRGLDRYDEAWSDRNREAWAAWKAAHPEKYPPGNSRRKSAGDPPEPRRPDPDPDPDAEKKPPPPTPSAGSQPPEPARPPSEEEDFLWASVCQRRNEEGLARELHRPSDWSGFVICALAQGFTLDELQTSHAAFLLDDDFRLRGWPTPVWMKPKVWQQRTRLPARRATL